MCIEVSLKHLLVSDLSDILLKSGNNVTFIFQNSERPKAASYDKVIRSYAVFKLLRFPYTVRPSAIPFLALYIIYT